MDGEKKRKNRRKKRSDKQPTWLRELREVAASPTEDALREAYRLFAKHTADFDEVSLDLSTDPEELVLVNRVPGGQDKTVRVALVCRQSSIDG